MSKLNKELLSRILSDEDFDEEFEVSVPNKNPKKPPRDGDRPKKQGRPAEWSNKNAAKRNVI